MLLLGSFKVSPDAACPIYYAPARRPGCDSCVIISDAPRISCSFVDWCNEIGQAGRGRVTRGTRSAPSALCNPDFRFSVSVVVVVVVVTEFSASCSASAAGATIAYFRAPLIYALREGYENAIRLSLSLSIGVSDNMIDICRYSPHLLGM